MEVQGIAPLHLLVGLRVFGDAPRLVERLAGQYEGVFRQEGVAEMIT